MFLSTLVKKLNYSETEMLVSGKLRALLTKLKFSAACALGCQYSPPPCPAVGSLEPITAERLQCPLGSGQRPVMVPVAPPKQVPCWALTAQ